MARSCTSCQNVKRPEIDRRLAGGEPVAQVARDYDLNPSSLHRHRTNCLKLASSNHIMKEVARGSAAVALLPSKETLSAAYDGLRTRIDQIVEQAQQEGSLNVAISGLNSAQRQSAEAVRRVRESLIKAGAELESDNVFALELKNGSRVLALPSSDDSIRGLTVDGWIVADEAARLPNDLIAALRPMRARRPQARFAMLSTAWSRTDPFWTAWAGDEQSWIRLKATADEIETFSAEFLEQERRALGDEGFKREYLGIPIGGHASPFIWEWFERATQIHTPVVPPGPAFAPPVAEPAVPTANPFKSVKPMGEYQ